MANWVFLPDDTDPLLQTSLRSLSAFLVHSTVAAVGRQALAGLNLENPARLYVLGHGNWGAGIGSHKKHFGARTLARALMDEGLSPQQMNLEIHLFACNSGVSSAAVMHTRKPFVQRFAKALAAQGFNATTIYGYIGFLNVVTLQLHTQYKGGTMAGSASSTKVAANQVVYGVNGGQAAKIIGGDFEMKSTFGWRKVDVVAST